MGHGHVQQVEDHPGDHADRGGQRTALVHGDRHLHALGLGGGQLVGLVGAGAQFTQVGDVVVQGAGADAEPTVNKRA